MEWERAAERKGVEGGQPRLGGDWEREGGEKEGGRGGRRRWGHPATRAQAGG